MTTADKCGCRRGAAANLKALLEGRDAPECQHHTGTGPLQTRTEDGWKPSPMALNDDAGLARLIGAPLAKDTRTFETNNRSEENL